MLTIPDQQMQELAEVHRGRFVVNAVEALTARWPDLAERLDAAGFAAAVREAVLRSEGYGIDEPDDITAYLEVMGALGDPDFDRGRPWAAAILGNDCLDAALKCRELEEGAARELSPPDPDDHDDLDDLAEDA